MSTENQSVPATPPGALALTGEDSSPLPVLIHRYLSGESLEVLAHELHVTRPTLRSRILRACLSGELDVDYHTLVTHALISRIADADEMLDAASDSLSVARAREIARFSRMDFERRRANLYGVKNPDQGDKILVIVQREVAKEPLSVPVTEAEFRVEK